MYTDNVSLYKFDRIIMSTSRRVYDLPNDWFKIRLRILKRDNYTCCTVGCSSEANQVDHVDRARGWDHGDANLQSLCSYHHNIKTSREANEERKRINKLKINKEQQSPLDFF